VAEIVGQVDHPEPEGRREQKPRHGVLGGPALDRVTPGRPHEGGIAPIRAGIGLRYGL